MSISEALANSAIESVNLVKTNKSKFAREHGVSNSGLRWRIENGWPVERWGEEARKPIDYGSFIGHEYGHIVIESIHQEGICSASGNKKMIVVLPCAPYLMTTQKNTVLNVEKTNPSRRHIRKNA